MCESQIFAPSLERALWNLQTEGVRDHKLHRMGCVLPDAAEVFLPVFVWPSPVWEDKLN
jgi:hypothetical protein